MAIESVLLRSRAHRWACIGFGILVIFWFGTLGLRPLYKADESRYGEIPREMLESGDWVTPRLNGFKYFEKPPLQYWATAVVYRTLGVGDFTARLWTSVLGFLGLLLTYFAGQRIFDVQVAQFAAVLLVASPLYVGASQFITLDMGLTFFLSAAMFAFAIGQQERKRGWILAFWAACALAVLSKGLVGIVLPVVAIGLYVLVRRDWELLGRLELVRGGALFLAIAAPWFIAVSLANPEFAHFFFVQEHLQRFTTQMHHRYQPPWYFIPILVAGTAPWVLALVAGWARGMRAGPGVGFDARRFLAIWAMTVFVFFSVSSSKLPAYILPVVPALALLAGLRLCGAGSQRLLQSQCVLIVMLAAATAAFAFTGRVEQLAGNTADFPGRYGSWLLAGAALLGTGAIGAAWAARAGALRASLGLLALGAFGCTLLALVGHRTVSANYSVASLVAALPIPVPRDAQVFALKGYDHTMPWVLRRPVTMVGSKDELAEAIRGEPEKFIADLDGFTLAWNAAASAYAFVPVGDFDRILTATGLSVDILARGARYVIVKKP